MTNGERLRGSTKIQMAFFVSGARVSHSMPPKIALSENDEFRKSRNAVIREAVRLLHDPQAGHKDRA